MVRVAPVKLQADPKVLWFDPADCTIESGDDVIVSTERGTEYGTATSGIIEVSDELVANLRSPLKPVLRVATSEDVERATDLVRQGDEALAVFRELADESNADMHPVMVEFLFDGDKAIFYFEAEERIDFRDLVRKLANHFHVRVDMRQIGVRDAARMVGGLGHCGQELCCRRLGGEFNPVSIRMAKEQNLSLNPQKISGCCGRLMCCLRYEFDTYKEFNSRAPKLGAKVDLPEGTAKVTEVNVPNETIALRLPEGKTIHVPLTEFEAPEEGRRPHVISQETYDKYTRDDTFEKLSAALFEVATFTGEEKLADPGKRSNLEERATSTESSSRRRSSSRRPRRRGGNQASGEQKAQSSQRSGGQKPASRGDRPAMKQTGAHHKPAQEKAAEGASSTRSENRRRRRRRSSSTNTTNTTAIAPTGTHALAKAAPAGRPATRPGQKSSGMPRGEAPKQSKGQGETRQASAGSHRRSRRRRHTANGGSAQGGNTDAS
jgi:cell fate regulator YaaT (PSP1 superfamily)